MAKKLKWSRVPEESSTSSSDEDLVPILPETSSDELSVVFEEDDFDNSSTYMSSLVDCSSSDITTDSVRRRLNETVTVLNSCQRRQAPVETEEDLNQISNIYSLQQSTVLQIDLPNEEHRPHLDPNTFHRSKNFSHGLMNLALFAANGNQLKYLIESAEDRPLFLISFSFLITSIVIQIFVKACLMLSCRYNLMNVDDARKARRVNNVITYAVSFLAFVNFALTGIILVEMNFGFLFAKIIFQDHK